MDNIKININPLGFSDFMDSDSQFIPIVGDDGEDLDTSDGVIPDELPLLPLRNTVLFPGVIVPISIGREKSMKLIKDVQKSKGYLGAVSQIDYKIDEPTPGDLNRIGTVARIIKILEMPDNSTSVIIQGKKRFAWNKITSEDPYFKASVTVLEDVMPDTDKKREFEAVIGSLKDLSLKIIRYSTNIPPEASFAVKNIENPVFLINYIGANAEIKSADKQRILEIDDLKERGLKLVEHLVREVQLLEIKNDIQLKVKLDMDQQQREYLLHQQMKTIQDELGTSPIEQEIREMEVQAKKKKWSKDVAATFQKELDKMQRLNPASGEYSIQFNYLQSLLDIPWDEYTRDNFD
jgi:ATP-dependent Lon protease